MIKAIVQPRDGIGLLIDAMSGAKKSIETTIYRADRLEIEQALIEAVARGLDVHILTTRTNREDEKNLMRLESRLAKFGVRVSLTPEDLVRYHNKMLIIDRRTLYLLTFNFTFLDIHHSRGLGIITDEPAAVQDAIGIFELDSMQTESPPVLERLIVSPFNARTSITDFIQGAERQLLIYDGRLNDARIIRVLERKARLGVEVKVIGKSDRRARDVEVRPMPDMLLHAQAIIRDGKAIFLGSQSLRKAELDDRREVGIIISERKVVQHFRVLFEVDWGDIIAELPE
jgi:phosphatidylserine/phosphatidylglycerophosphate/cardiolipin synthase-like enzyme